MQNNNRQLHQFCSVLLILILLVAMPLSAFAQKSKSPTAAVSKLTEQQRVIHLLDRITFGARPGEVERINQIGWQKYLEEQMQPEKISDVIVTQKLGSLATLKMSDEQIAKTYDPPQEVIKQLRDRFQPQNTVQENVGETVANGEMKAEKPKTVSDADFMSDPKRRREYAKALMDLGYRPRQEVVNELQASKLIRAVSSERQMQEVLTDFWFNHFNVFASKGADRYLITNYENQVVRPNVFGKFEDLLLATAKSPAMLFYLDNWLSTAPDAKMPDFQRLRQMRQERMNNPTNNPKREMRQLERLQQRQMTDPKMAEQMTQQQAQGKRRRGINENYAREIMELHTLGVDGGYTQKDVQEVARCLTGWTMRQPRTGGGFYYAPAMHDDGEKVVLGQKISSGGGEQDGVKVIKLLAHHPATAKFISTKLARKFVSDNPPASLIEKMSQTFLKKDGDLREVYKTMLTSNEFWAAESYRAKIKTPFEMTVSAARALGAETNGSPQFHKWIQQMGEGLFLAQPPTGYADTAETWVNTGALLERMNFALALSGNKIFGTNVNFPEELKAAKPNQVADYFIKTILHGNLSPQTRSTLDKTLADAQIANNGKTDVAKIAGLILGSPEFQRQ
jgi:uncharacterized protein (DUF1800 family)